MILIGQKLWGYCGGMFGRDWYGEKRVEAVGVDWIIVREDNSDYPLFACSPTIHEDLAEYGTELAKQKYLVEN